MRSSINMGGSDQSVGRVFIQVRNNLVFIRKIMELANMKHLLLGLFAMLLVPFSLRKRRKWKKSL